MLKRLQRCLEKLDGRVGEARSDPVAAGGTAMKSRGDVAGASKAKRAFYAAAKRRIKLEKRLAKRMRGGRDRQRGQQQEQAP